MKLRSAEAALGAPRGNARLRVKLPKPPPTPTVFRLARSIS
jgi:hypothetical protein